MEVDRPDSPTPAQRTAADSAHYRRQLNHRSL